MSTWDRIDNRAVIPALLALAACTVTGFVAGIQPALGLGLALGLTFGAVVLTNVLLGLVLFTVLSFLEVTAYSGAALSFMKIAGLILFVAWLAKAATERRHPVLSVVRSNRTLIVPAVAFLAWSAISFAWAESPSVAGATTWRYLQDLLLLPIVIGTIRRREHVIWIMIAFIVGSLAAGLYGFAFPQPTNARDFGRLSGTNLDANGLAAGLVVAVAFSVGLLEAARRRPGLRFLLGITTILSLIGVFATLSRSGLVALAAMLIAGVLIGGRWRPQAAILLVITAGCAAVYFGALAPATADQHVTSADTAGRSTLWTVGLRMFEAHPILGVGSGNFSVASIHFEQQPGTITRADLVVDRQFPAHNIYLQIASDLGIPGLLAFLWIVAATIAAALRAAARFRDTGRRDLELMARSLVLALVGYLASSFFQPEQFSKQLWTLVAIGPALLTVAAATSRAPARRWKRSATTRRPALAGAVS